MKSAVALFAATAFALSSLYAADVKHSRPNIILVMPDDLGYGDYSCLGNPVNKTPNVDAFWKQSVRFTDFHVSPTCAPTRSALFSGRHEFKNGVTHTILERERMSLKTITLAQTLKSAGYTTGIFGKWHLGDEADYQPEKRGFDETFIHGSGGIGQMYPGSGGDVPGNMYTNPTLIHNGAFEKTKGYCTDLFFGQATKWIDQKRNADTPFFCYIPLNVAHEPLQCPNEYFEHYKGKVPDNVAKFYGMIETVDLNFGRLIDQLKTWGLEENTLVIYIGTDNGGYAPACAVFNAGMRGSKLTPFQGGTRAPLFMRWPAQFPGGRDISALTAHIDIFPTLAEIIGIPLKGELAKQIEGRSFWPLLTNVKAEWPDRTLVTHVGRWDKGHTAEAKFAGCSIRNSRFTLVNNRQLFDLQNDPGESKNVIEDHADEAAKLRAEYDKWWTDVQPMLVNEDAIGPKINPIGERYWKEFGGSPTPAQLRLMDPTQPWPPVRQKPK